MVFQFKSKVDGYLVFMGKDKYENEKLIKYHHPEDVWFHVDKFSSAHVYLRPLKIDDDLEGLIEEEPWKLMDRIPDDVIEEICQVTKENSIQGKKEKSARIVYTLASNLKKTGDMDVGQVSYYKRDPKYVRYYTVQKRDATICNAYKKQKVWVDVDFSKEKQERLNEIQEWKNRMKREKERKKEERIKKAREEKKMKNYEGFFESDPGGIDDDDIYGSGSDGSIPDDVDDFI